ncbi:MAG: hypothetical protein N2255_05050 [Kiritimatiellae bacterium]|nr:hypothetical protein [Kiritimatiellia bacterium]
MAISLKKNSVNGDAATSSTVSPAESVTSAGQGPQMTQADIAAMAIGRRGTVPVQSAGSYTWAAVIGLICVVLLGALILIQLMENSFYQGAIPVKPYVAGPSAR